VIQDSSKSAINKKSVVSFLKFCLVGASGTLITLGTEFILTEFFYIWYGLSLTIGWMLGFLNNFTWNRQWTFKSTSGKIPKQMVLYFVSVIIALVANLTTTIFLTEFVGIWYFHSSILSVAVSTLIDFILIKNYALKPNSQDLKNTSKITRSVPESIVIDKG
jgi:putative flippase GtrA